MKRLILFAIIFGVFLPFAWSQTVNSITLVDPTSTNQSSVNFTVTFSEAIAGVVSDNFSLEVTGGVGGTIEDPTTSDNITWNVEISSVTGDGTLRIDFVTNQGESPIVAAFTTGETYIIDNTTDTPTLDAPAASTSDNSTLDVDFTLAEAASGGTVIMTFELSSGTDLNAPHEIIFNSNFETAANHTTTLNGADLSNNVNVTSVSSDGNDALVDGAVYDVTISYQDAFGNTAATDQNTSFTYDISTEAPTLAAPAAGSFDNGTLDIDFTLPEAATSGSVTLTFNRTGGSADGDGPHEITFVAGFETAGQHTTTLDGAELSSDANVASVSSGANDNLKDGAEYTVTLSYQDALGNTAATDESLVFTYDLATETPTLDAPASSTSENSSIDLDFTLPEAAAAGSVTLTFAINTGVDANAPHELTFNNSGGFEGAGQHTTTLDATDFDANSNVEAIGVTDLLVDGVIYDVTLSYQDALNNTVAIASNASVTYVLDNSTIAPTLDAPAASTSDNSALDVDFTLAEAASGGTVIMTFELSSGTDLNAPHEIIFNSNFETAANHTTTLNGADLSNNVNVTSVSSDGNDALVDGAVYDVTISYQDAFGNTAATDQNTSFTYDISTEAPTLAAPAAGSFDNGTLDIDFTLPEAAIGGSVTLTFNRTGGSADGDGPHEITFVAGFETAGQHTATLDGADLSSDANVASVSSGANDNLKDGAEYTVTLSYQDALGNTAATDESLVFTYDLATEAPTLDAPASSTSENSSIDLDFTLPEAATSGTVTLTFTENGTTLDGNDPHVITFNNTGGLEDAGQHTLTLDATDFSINTNVFAISSGANDALEDGATYDVEISYQDLAQNTAATATNTTIVYDNTPPSIIAAITVDSDNNGYIDQVIITFNENINDATLNDIDFDVVGYDDEMITSGSANDDEIIVDFDEGATPDTDATPDIDVAADAYTDMVSNGTLAQTFSSTEDGAAPVVVTASTLDADANGEIDGITITLSEPIDDSNSTLNSTTFDVSYSSDNVDSDVTDDEIIILTFNESGGADTEVLLGFTLNSGKLEDFNANSSGLNQVFGATADGAPPIILAATTSPLAGGSNIGVNSARTISFTFSEDVTAQSGTLAIYNIDDQITPIVSADVNDGNVSLSSPNVTWDHNTLLEKGESYVVTFTSGAYEDLNGVGSLELTPVSENAWGWDMTSDSNPKFVYSPQEGQLNVAPFGKIEFYFDAPVRLQNSTQKSITIYEISGIGGTEDATVWTGRVDTDGSNLPTFILPQHVEPDNTASNYTTLKLFDITKTPELSFSPNTFYRVTVVPDGFEYDPGDRDTDEASVDFQTSGDNIRPTVDLFSPVNNAPEVLISTNSLSIDFSENVKAGYGNIELWANLSTDIKVLDIASNSSLINYSNDIATIDISSLTLSGGVEYYVNIEDGAITDAIGNTFVGFSDETTWTFTMETESNAPEVVAFTPADNSTNVDVSTDLEIEFNEPIQKTVSGGYLTVRLAANGYVTDSIHTSDPEFVVNGNIATISLPEDLGGVAAYYINLEPGSLEDLGGNDFPGITGSFRWNFTTGSDVVDPTPVAESFSPLHTADDISINTAIDLYMNEIISPIAGNDFELRLASNNSLVFDADVTSTDVAVSGNQITVNLPELNYNTEYYVIFQAGSFEDGSQNTNGLIGGNGIWNFTTESDLSAPAITALSPVNGAGAFDPSGVSNEVSITVDEDITAVNGRKIRLYNAVNDTLIQEIDGSDGAVETLANVATITFSKFTTNGLEYYITMDAGFLQDNNGNNIDDIDPGNWQFTTIDNIPPTASISRVDVTNGSFSGTNDDAIAFEIAFSEAVTNFTFADDITVNGTGFAFNFDDLTTSDNVNYLLSLNNITGDGSLSITISNAGSGDAIEDSGGLNLTASVGPSDGFVIDNSGPTLVNITRISSQLTNANTLSFLMDFDDVVDPLTFGVSDLVIAGTASAGAVLGSIAQQADLSRFIVTVNSIDGDGTLSLDFSGSVSDDAGNEFNSPETTDQEYTIDNTRPEVTNIVFDPVSNPNNSSPIQATITWDESVTGFTNSDLVLTGANAAAVVGGGDTYTVNLTPTGDGNLTIRVAGNTALDLAGNNNIASAIYSIGSDRTAPIPTGSFIAFEGTITMDLEMDEDNATIYYMVGTAMPTVPALMAANSAVFLDEGIVKSVEATIPNLKNEFRLYYMTEDGYGNQSSITTKVIPYIDGNGSATNEFWVSSENDFAIQLLNATGSTVNWDDDEDISSPLVTGMSVDRADLNISTGVPNEGLYTRYMQFGTSVTLKLNIASITYDQNPTGTSFLTGDDPVSITASMPAGHNVSFSGVGLGSTQSTANTILVDFYPETAGEGSHPINYTISNNITGETYTFTRTFDVASSAVIYAVGTELSDNYCIDEGVQVFDAEVADIPLGFEFYAFALDGALLNTGTIGTPTGWSIDVSNLATGTHLMERKIVLQGSLFPQFDNFTFLSDNFITHPLPDVEITSIADGSEFCREDAGVNIFYAVSSSVNTSVNEGISPANYNVEVIGSTTNSNVGASVSLSGLLVFDNLLANATIGLQPGDSEVQYRLTVQSEGVQDPNTNGSCINTATVDFTVYDTPAEPVLSNDLTDHGTVSGGNYQFEYCVGDVIPDFIGVGDSITYQSNNTELASLSNTLPSSSIFGGNNIATSAGTRTIQFFNLSNYSSGFDGCESAAKTITIIIHEVPDVPVIDYGLFSAGAEVDDNVYEYNYCEGDLIDEIILDPTLENQLGYESYFVVFDETISSVLYTTQDLSIDFTAPPFNLTSNVESHTYYIAQNNNDLDLIFANDDAAFDGCLSGLTTLNINIREIPERPLEADFSQGSYAGSNQFYLCQGDGLEDIDLPAPEDNAYYVWYQDDAGAASTIVIDTDGDGETLTEDDIPVVFDKSIPGDYTFWVRKFEDQDTEADFDGCPSDAQSVTITVYPDPEAPVFTPPTGEAVNHIDLTEGDTEIEVVYCSEEAGTVQFEVNGLPNSDYTWYESNANRERGAEIRSSPNQTIQVSTLTTDLDGGFNGETQYFLVSQTNNIDPNGTGDSDDLLWFDGCETEVADMAFVKLTIFPEPTKPLVKDYNTITQTYFVCQEDADLYGLRMIGNDIGIEDTTFTWYDINELQVATGDSVSAEDLGILSETGIANYTFYVTQTHHIGDSLASFPGCESELQRVLVYEKPSAPVVDFDNGQYNEAIQRFEFCRDNMGPGSEAAILKLIATEGSGIIYHWYDENLNEVSVTPSLEYNTGEFEVGEYTFYVSRQLYTNEFTGCESDLTPVSFNIYANPELPELQLESSTLVDEGDYNFVFCEGLVDPNFQFKISNTQPDVVYEWYATESSISPFHVGDSISMQEVIDEKGLNINDASSGGEVDIHVLAVGLGSCESAELREVKIQITEPPNPSMTWSGITEGKNTLLSFFNENPRVDELTDITLLQYIIKRNGVGIDSSSVENFYASEDYTFTNPGEYEFELIMRTSEACLDTINRKISILPQVKVTNSGISYDFDEDDQFDHGWFAEYRSENGKADNRESSWEWGEPVINEIKSSDGTSTNVLGASSGTKAWKTNLNGNYFGEEQSWVYSPSFDISEIELPIISFNHQHYFADFRDGVVLQYSVDNGESWKPLGDFDPGENAENTAEAIDLASSGLSWYTNSDIASDPGTYPVNSDAVIGDFNNNSRGWSERQDKFGGTTDWLLTSHLFVAENVGEGDPALKTVRFRFALSSNAGDETLNDEGFAFDDFSIYNGQKFVLLENFTTMLSQDSKNVTEEHDQMASEVPGVVWVNYFTDLFSSVNDEDAISERNVVDPAARTSFYGISKVPAAVIEGTVQQRANSNSPTIFREVKLSKAGLRDRGFDITLDASFANGVISAAATYTSTSDIPDPDLQLSIRFLIVEKWITGLSNGVYTSTDTLQNVLRKILPNAAGINKFGAITAGTVFNETVNWKVENLYTPEAVNVITFVQNEHTKEVYQIVETELPAISEDEISVGFKEFASRGFAIYPNPADENVGVELHQATSKALQWVLYDQAGREVIKGNLGRGSKSMDIDSNELPSGIYMLHLFNEDAAWKPKRLVIIHK